MNTIVLHPCFTLEDIAAKLTPFAIHARMLEIRMGDIIMKTKPGADAKANKCAMSF